jgi:acetoin utilization protein AcuB
MLVQKWMTPDPVTLQVNDSVHDALRLLKERDIWHLPVMEGDRLVGIVTDRDLKEFSPSKATTLDVYELRYVLSKAPLASAMHKDPLWLRPEDTIEKAALLMHDNKIGCLPVEDDSGKLVGILTRDDVFEALVMVTGSRSGTTRFQMTIADAPGSLKDVADRVRTHGLKVRSLLTSTADVQDGQRELIVRVEGDTAGLEGEFKAEHADLIVHKD